MMYHEIAIYRKYKEEEVKLLYEFIQNQYESALDDYELMENHS